MKRRLAALVVLVVIAATALGFWAAPAKAAPWTNGYRVEHGFSVLHHSPYLNYKAEQWAKVLAARGTLSHGDLPRFGRYHVIGQNVGVGPSWWAVQEAFYASPEHRANILDPQYKQTGVGLAYAGGLVYVVEDFRG